MGYRRRVMVPDEIRQAIAAHARWAFPDEACGLLAGDVEGRLKMAYCLSNIDRGPTGFLVDPIEHFGALRHAERYGWQISGSFHSHPRTEAVPSPADVAGALDPEWVYLIAGPVGDEVPVRAFSIRSGQVDELATETS